MKKRFEALDAFRGLAALSVVVYHMHLVGSITELGFFRGSSIFVELFFVLSGFVLAHGYGEKANITFFRFMRSRFYRLYPLHFFMFIVFFALEVGKLAAYEYVGFSFNNPPFTHGKAVSEILPNLLLLQSWTSMSNHLSFNYPSWSVSIEFYLYLLLFLSIVIFKNFKYIVWVLVAIIALYMVGVGSELFVEPVLRGLSCFFGGASMYLLYKKISHIKVNKIMGSIVELGIIAAVVMVVQFDFSGRSVSASIIFFLTILVFSFESGIFSDFLKLKPFQKLGQLSYSIYMTHAAILFCLISTMLVFQKVTGLGLAPMIDETRYLTFGGAGFNNLAVMAILAFVILISSFTYKYIELRWQKKYR